MGKYDEFFSYVDEVVCSMPGNIKKQFDELKAFHAQDPIKPLFTENGLKILTYMQSNQVSRVKAKDIAQGMDTASRQISGALRKLVTDGFVDKCGQNPVIYSLTEKGKNFNIEAYVKENNSNEKEDQ